MMQIRQNGLCYLSSDPICLAYVDLRSLSIKGGVAVRRRRPQPLPQEGCNVLQKETPQTPVRLDKSDAQATGGEHSKAQAHAQYSSTRARQQVAILERYCRLASRMNHIEREGSANGRCKSVVPLSPLWGAILQICF